MKIFKIVYFLFFSAICAIIVFYDLGEVQNDFIRIGLFIAKIYVVFEYGTSVTEDFFKDFGKTKKGD
ncbi:hypothetical protein KY334_04090 [Candidatus Woesearchaeota archaeon]|nr:hypothetical protein [Candidatus Woesearchaeota archaeon]